MRVWLVGFGTVGRWLAAALASQAERLAARYDVDVTVVGVANARDGFVYGGDGLDLRSLLKLSGDGRPLAEHAGISRWPTALGGMQATEADLLVEVTASPATDGEPGISHMREALGRGIPVVTSNKWPVALHGVELAGLARRRGVAVRAESTVMSGTPLLSSLIDGLAGATPVGLRGLLNATVNFILSRMAEGRSYEEALAEAQAAGLAERDPAADVEGQDSVAKLMILSALVFGRQLRPDQVACRGIAGIARSEVDEAAAAGKAAQARRDARVLRAGRGRGGDGARGARAPSTGRSARAHRRHHQRRGVPRHPGRRGRCGRAGCRPGARRAGRAQRPDRGGAGVGAGRRDASQSIGSPEEGTRAPSSRSTPASASRRTAP
jgi:homoserine dehydrogenase